MLEIRSQVIQCIDIYDYFYYYKIYNNLIFLVSKQNFAPTEEWEWLLIEFYVCK